LEEENHIITKVVSSFKLHKMHGKRVALLKLIWSE
jgi:hypothetical protein